mgnify:CR=1 FL=1
MFILIEKKRCMKQLEMVKTRFIIVMYIRNGAIYLTKREYILKRSFKEHEDMEKSKKRTVVLIEAARDQYFSKEGAFAEDYHRKIEDYATGYRGKFTIPELSWESHHAAPLELLKKLDYLNLDTNLRPQNLKKDTFYKICLIYEKLIN